VPLATTPVVVNAWTNVRIRAVQDKTVTLDSGANSGVRSGVNVPVVRDGNVVAILRVQTVAATESTALITWSDELASPLEAGDTIRIENVSVSTTPDTGRVVETGQEARPVISAPVLYETGLSNAVVPRADRAYEFLAALAASGLITRYPAHLFHDEGTRRHRTEEDITFSRAQIADLIREAVGNVREGKVSSKQRIALNALSREFAPEVRALNFTPEQQAVLQSGGGFQFGTSGQQRISLVGRSSDGDIIDPFSERFGGRRTRSGLDTRTNIFGQFNDRLQFFATIDGGTDTSRNTKFDERTSVRRALLSYDAGSLLRGLTVEIGRNEYWWGPGHFGTLLLSDVAGPLNSIHTVFKRGSYQLEGLYAPLGRNGTSNAQSFYGHNLQVRLGPNTRIGVAESLVLPRSALDAASFASTFLPIPLIITERLSRSGTSKENGEYLVQAYAETSLARGTRIYGELLIDDIGVNSNNIVRNRLGTLLGMHLFSPEDPARLGLHAEFTNLQGRTYLPLTPGAGADYFYRGAPLGYAVAPEGDGRGGAESLRFEAYWRPKARLRLSTGFEFADLNSEDDVIARQQTFRFRAAYDLSRTYTLVGRVQRVSTDNIGNNSGVNAKQTQFQLELARAF
jgi:hypothetical protein